MLFRHVLSGEITVDRLVRMTPEQLASPELATWREQEAKHVCIYCFTSKDIVLKLITHDQVFFFSVGEKIKRRCSFFSFPHSQKKPA